MNSLSRTQQTKQPTTQHTGDTFRNTKTEQYNNCSRNNKQTFVFGREKRNKKVKFEERSFLY